MELSHQEKDNYLSEQINECKHLEEELNIFKAKYVEEQNNFNQARAKILNLESEIANNLNIQIQE